MESRSVYRGCPKDTLAKYFTRDNFAIINDGSMDVSNQLQRAINSIVSEYGYGILYVPEGKYLLSKTIYIPKAVRIIGYGSSRPEFILMDNAENFNKPLSNDKGGYRYMFWFVDRMVTDESQIADANPGTFYSAMSNVDISLGRGNKYAVALRTHYAQHAFLSHMHISVMSGMAGIYDVGNEMENISISGGKYAVITTKCSPGWPFMMVDTCFENQEIAAIKTHEAGLTIVRNSTKNAPRFIDVDEGYFEKLIIEDSVFENISETLLDVAMDENCMTQINVRNIACIGVNQLARYKDSGRVVSIAGVGIINYIHGTVISDVESTRKIIDELEFINDEINIENILRTDIKLLPNVSEWVNVTDIGLVGDGVTDNSNIIADVIAKNKILYFPQGEYLFTEPIALNKDTMFIGMHPWSTRLILKDNSESFTGIGPMKAFVETPIGGVNIINGIGIETGGKNPRASALVWKAGKDSYVNDVKLVGGHGNLVKGTGEFEAPYNETRTADANKERMWDAQYPSFVVKNGGGTFKDIWSASPYATAGFEVQESDVESRVYCMSLEHHQRNELRLKGARNWRFYALQTEEELVEGEYALPIEIIDCENISFFMTYFFRTIFVKTPFDYCVKCYNSVNIEFYNIHNCSQMKYEITGFLNNCSEGSEIRLWQAAKAVVGASEYNALPKEKATVIRRVIKDENEILVKELNIERIFGGFRFADGGTTDSNGNFYFVDSLDKRVYRIDIKGKITIMLESPVKINSIAIDTEDNLIYIGEYVIPVGATQNGVPQTNELPPDSYGTSYGYWYNKDAFTFVFTCINGEIVPLEKINIGTIKPELVYYPGNRWRDGADFAEILTYNPKQAYIAPDGKTIIPCHYDLIRANNLSKARPGEKLYSVDEMYKRVFVCEVLENGLLTNARPIVEQGDYCVIDSGEKLYVCDDNIKECDYKGNIEAIIKSPERCTTIGMDAAGKNIKYITTRNRVYVLKG